MDRGTGHVSWVYNEKQRCVSLIVKSENDGSTLLEAKMFPSNVYKRQQVSYFFVCLTFLDVKPLLLDKGARLW